MRRTLNRMEPWWCSCWIIYLCLQCGPITPQRLLNTRWLGREYYYKGHVLFAGLYYSFIQKCNTTLPLFLLYNSWCRNGMGKMATHTFQLQVFSWNLCSTNFALTREHYKFIHREHVINHLHDIFTPLMSFTLHWFNLKCKWHISLYLTSAIISSTSDACSVYSIFAYPT